MKQLNNKVMKARQIVLRSHPIGMPTENNFGFEEIEISAPKDGEVLLKSQYISVDPYMRGRMSDEESYIKPFELGKPIDGGAIATVIESESDILKKGDRVVGMLPWATYSKDKADRLRKIHTDEFPDGYYLGVLGMPGLTAYFGVMDICQPRYGETMVISGAAGAVGLVAGQIARIQGCKVLEITGSDEKVNVLKNEFGFDMAINYKTTKDLSGTISELCPKGVDCYFDNVGGEVSEAVIAHLNYHARIALCGQIASYNTATQEMGPRLLPQILSKSGTIKGFIVGDYQKRFLEGLSHLMTWLKEGKLHYTETIIDGFDKLPYAFLGLFSGKNIGKMLVKVSE